MARLLRKFRLVERGYSRRDILRLTGAASAAGLAWLMSPGIAGGSNKDGKGVPNIVFILGDNHHAGAMNCAGHPFIRTPGMDRLAREGIRFENAFNTTSLCSPSRASILTGAYAHKHGVRNNHTPWTGEMTTFLEHLSRSGYATAFIGKWHMPGEGLPDMPFLDLFVSYTYREGQGAYFHCPMIVNGKEVPSRKPYITEEVTDYAIEFMRGTLAEQKGGCRPFCIYLSHRPGHPPFRAPEGIAGMYDDEDVSMILPKAADPLWYGKTKGNVFQGVMLGSYHDQYRRYCETITAMDRDIERLLEAIDEMGVTDRTLVIYMGDNGMQWGIHDVHGIREPYEGCIRLPFIARAKWLTPDPGATRRQMALNIDLAPTILDAAGQTIPGDMDGESLVTVLGDPESPGRESFLLEYWRYYPENTPSYIGVRTERYKYVEFERGRGPWLFDLEKDPGERHNLLGTPEGKKVLPELKRLLEEWKMKRDSAISAAPEQPDTRTDLNLPYEKPKT